MDRFKWKRNLATVIVLAYGIIAGVIVCLGYNKFYFELNLPNGAVGQILDLMDYVSNNIFMPIVALATCILIGWVAKPKTVIDEVTKNGEKFNRKIVYNVTIKFIAPILVLLIMLQALGNDNF